MSMMAVISRSLLLTGIFFVTGAAASMQSSSPHTQLLKTLLVDSGYTPMAPPRIHVNQTVTVSVQLSLFQIIEINEKSQYLQIVASLNLRWNDEHLVWNPEDYGGLAVIHIPSKKLWKPDIALFNSVEGVQSSFHTATYLEAAVSSSGDVQWMMPVLFKSSCVIEVIMYPFDKQTCSIEFMSWVHTVREINATSLKDHVEVSAYKVNPQWILLDTSCGRSEVQYPCCQDPFAVITCHLTVLRRPLFYIYNLAFPCFLLMVIGGLVFRVPPESGEKISLAVTVLLAITVYMMVVMNNVPENSQVVPLLQKFIGTTVVLLTLSTILSVCLVKCQYQNSQRSRPPYWIRVLVLEWIAPLVLMKPHKQTRPASPRAHAADKGKNHYTNRQDTNRSPSASRHVINGRRDVYPCDTSSTAVTSLAPLLSVNSSPHKQQEVDAGIDRSTSGRRLESQQHSLSYAEQRMLALLQQQLDIMQMWKRGCSCSAGNAGDCGGGGGDQEVAHTGEETARVEQDERCSRGESDAYHEASRGQEPYDEWRTLVTVLDRLFFVMYFISVVVVLFIFCITIFLS